MLSVEKLSFEIPELLKKEKKALEVFHNYVRIGDHLSKNPGPELQGLEDVIKKESSDRGGFFMALVIPLFGGKTQMAFTIRAKRPLYFTFDQRDPLYKNFSVVSQKLKEYAGDDREKMKKYLMDNELIVRENDPTNPKGSSYDYIAINDFRHLNEIDSKTLGLFMALMQDGETKPQSIDWMKHYARPRKIIVEPISIIDFVSHPNHISYLNKYLIFLDEFYGDFDLLFIRNLCRYLKLACMMTAETQRDINIMSKEEAKTYKL